MSWATSNSFSKPYPFHGPLYAMLRTTIHSRCEPRAAESQHSSSKFMRLCYTNDTVPKHGGMIQLHGEEIHSSICSSRSNTEGAAITYRLQTLAESLPCSHGICCQSKCQVCSRIGWFEQGITKKVLEKQHNHCRWDKTPDGER